MKLECAGCREQRSLGHLDEKLRWYCEECWMETVGKSRTCFMCRLVRDEGSVDGRDMRWYCVTCWKKYDQSEAATAPAASRPRWCSASPPPDRRERRRSRTPSRDRRRDSCERREERRVGPSPGMRDVREQELARRQQEILLQQDELRRQAARQQEELANQQAEITRREAEIARQRHELQQQQQQQQELQRQQQQQQEEELQRQQQELQQRQQQELQQQFQQQELQRQQDLQFQQDIQRQQDRQRQQDLLLQQDIQLQQDILLQQQRQQEQLRSANIPTLHPISEIPQTRRHPNADLARVGFPNIAPVDVFTPPTQPRLELRPAAFFLNQQDRIPGPAPPLGAPSPMFPVMDINPVAFMPEVNIIDPYKMPFMGFLGKGGVPAGLPIVPNMMIDGRGFKGFKGQFKGGKGAMQPPMAMFAMENKPAVPCSPSPPPGVPDFPPGGFYDQLSAAQRGTSLKGMPDPAPPHPAAAPGVQLVERPPLTIRPNPKFPNMVPLLMRPSMEKKEKKADFEDVTDAVA